MLNEIVLKGVLRDVEYSHTIDVVDFNKASIVCKR